MSILWYKKLVLMGVLAAVCGCGFRPLYTGHETADSVGGQQLRAEQASIFIDEIPDRTGQQLRRTLVDQLTPLGEPANPRYRLNVRLSNVSIAEQGVRLDNLATRYEMTYTGYYTLTSYPDEKVLLKDKTTARASYDVQRSPYASHVAEQAMTGRVMKILGEDIALRLAAFLKSKTE